MITYKLFRTKMEEDDIVKSTAYSIRKTILNDICNTIHNEKIKQQSTRVPHGLFKKLLAGANSVCPSITLNTIMNAYRKSVKMGNLINENESDNQTETADENATALDEDAPVDLIEESRPPMQNRQKGGRPAGTTAKRKRVISLATVAAKNEISRIFKDEKQALRKGKRMKRGRLEQIVTKICRKRNIPHLPEETIKTIRQREWRKRTFITSVGGLVSPLLAVEPKVVSIILQMCRICQCLTPT